MITGVTGVTTTSMEMFEYEFMRNAFAAAAVVAVVAGVVGYVLVLRGQTFAGHALAHIGFTGATGAVLIGVPPLWGLVLLTVLGGVGMGAMGEGWGQRDVAIGLVLSLALGFGLLFLHFFTGFATQVTSLLFGNVLAVEPETVWTLAGLGAVSLGVLGVVGRPLLFASLQPELAEARGVSVRGMGMVFLAVVALTVAACTQIVGVLLVFTLMVGPAAAAQRLVARVGPGMAVAVGLALVEAWGGIVLAYWTDWPVSFWISALSGGVYGVAVAISRR